MKDRELPATLGGFTAGGAFFGGVDGFLIAGVVGAAAGALLGALVGAGLVLLAFMPRPQDATSTPAHGPHANYMLIWGALFVMTMLEVGVAFLALAKLAIILTLIVLAVWKALLVALYYMHLKTDQPMFKRFFVLGIVAAALPDLRAILQPPPAPLVVPPGSPSPYFLWVSIDSNSPRHFRVVFESNFWSNRQAEFKVYGGVDGSVRAEIPLRRLSRELFTSEDDGTIWIERRRRFLGREYVAGERVGRYFFSYVSRLEHE